MRKSVQSVVRFLKSRVFGREGPGVAGGRGPTGETIRGTGLGRGLSVSLARWRMPRTVHDPGQIVTDLAAALALGGDCLVDIAVPRGTSAVHRR